MNTVNIPLPPHLQKLVDMNVSGLDIMHGHLKLLMLEAEQQLDMAQKAEDESGEAMDSMDRTYAEGYLDSLVSLYQLTYDLSFAIAEKENKNA